MPMKLCPAGKHFFDAGEGQNKQCPECRKDEQQAINSEDFVSRARIPTDETPRAKPDRGLAVLETKDVDPKNRPQPAPDRDIPKADRNPFAYGTRPTPGNQGTVILPSKQKQSTIPKPPAPIDTAPITDPRDLPTTGWLVIVEGPGRGRDFRLIQGENRIGRGQDMEVCLDFGAASDTAVSRDAHAVVIYDHHANEFFIERGRSRNLPLLNDQTIRRDQNLTARDIIQVGQTRLLFAPLCDEQFQW